LQFFTSSKEEVRVIHIIQDQYPFPTCIAQEQQDAGSSPDGFLDCFPVAESDNGDQETQEPGIRLAIPHHAYGKDDGDTEVLAGIATSFASSFTSASHEDPLRSQRHSVDHEKVGGKGAACSFAGN
jgi:hypothetical protein